MDVFEVPVSPHGLSIDPHHIHGLYESTYLQKGPLESILYILYGAKCDLDII